MEVSPLAARLWRLLNERPGRYALDELRHDLRASKSAIDRALTELEERGLISIELEKET
mgnify:CR=1 FL=1